MTFVFTDVERSSLNWIQRESEMTVFVPAVNRLIEAECERRGGEVIGREGDGRSLMFTDPHAALDSALAIQRSLVTDPEPTGRLMIRIGLHSGRVIRLCDGELGGTPVNFVGRMHKVAHGGQTILSDHTRELVADHLAEDCRLIDLGIHSLRDFEPGRLWQLHHPDLQEVFPLLNTRRRYEAPQPRLPEFIGREAELETLGSLLDKPLITVTGPGGIGKTRLVRRLVEETGHTFADGVCYVELQELERVEQVNSVVCNALGVDQAQAATGEASIGRALADSRTLLILDNGEHVREGVARIAEAISTLQGPTLVVTSRLPLKVEGEYVVPLFPLPVWEGDSGEYVVIRPSAAVELFASRAREVRAEFDLTEANLSTVVRICELLDGIPLAIELVAAWTRTMSLNDIVERIQAEVSLLGDRPGSTRRSMEAAIDWSVDHLDGDTLSLLANLARFHPGVGARELQEVMDVDSLALFSQLDGLVERALVRVDRDCEPYRYRLLEPLRHKARRSGPVGGRSGGFERAHSRVYLDLAIEAEPRLRSSDEVETVRVISADLGNIRVAIEHALQTDGTERAAKAVYALHEFSFLRMSYELYSWADRVLNAPGLSRQAEADLLSIAALGAFNRGDLQTSEQLGLASQDAAKAAGVDPPILSCFALITAFGLAADFERANEQFQVALDWSTANDDSYFRVNSLVLASMAMSAQGAAEVGVDLALHALSLAESMGNPSSIAWSLAALGDGRRYSDLALAREHLDTAIRLARTTSARWIEGQALLNLSVVESQGGDWVAAAHACTAALAHCQQIPHPIQSGQAIRQAFVILCALGHERAAVPLLDTVRRSSSRLPPAKDLAAAVADAAERCETTLGDERYREATAHGKSLDERAAVVAGRTALVAALAAG